MEGVEVISFVRSRSFELLIGWKYPARLLASFDGIETVRALSPLACLSVTAMDRSVVEIFLPVR